MKLVILDTMSDVTKKVVKDFNSLTDTEFLRKYSCRKIVYYKRVLKYGDPYVRSPLAKIGKWLLKHM